MLYREDKFCILWEAVNEIEKLLAQPEHIEDKLAMVEPVAWIDAGSLKSLQAATGYALRYLTNDTENLNVDDVPLYLAPPNSFCMTFAGLKPREALTEFKKGYAKAELDLKREPLSDDRLAQLYRINVLYDPFIFARQVERAHGIGGEDE